MLKYHFFTLAVAASAVLLGCSQDIDEVASKGQLTPLKSENLRNTNKRPEERLIKSENKEAEMANGLLDGQLSVVRSENSEIIATLSYTNNQTYGVPLMFTSGKTADLIVIDDTGKKIWFWSMGMMFTQAIRETVMPAGKTQKVRFKIPADVAAKIGKGYRLEAVFAGNATESQRPAMSKVIYSY